VKITDVEAVVLRQAAVDEGIADGSQDDLVILVSTDEGITGIGEVDSAPEAVQALVHQRGSHAVATGLRDALIGEDPLEVERLWDRMYRSVIYVGRRGIAIHAISGIDIALWDLKGKALGRPVCELLGTPVRDRVRAYASMLMPDTPEETAERVTALREQGFTAVKLGWGPLGRDADHDVKLAAAAKEAGGEGTEIMIDAGLGYVADAPRAIRVARQLEELGVYWLEEPFEPDEYEAYAELADTVDITVAAGEQDVTRWGFRELIERGHVDLVQPDVTRCGGITNLMRVDGLCKARNLPFSAHCAPAISAHAGCAMETIVHLEYFHDHVRIERMLFDGTLDPAGGALRPDSARPGLGLELKPAVAAGYRVSGEGA